MEPRFGMDFAKVQVHTDVHAADSAKALHARAYTVGHNVIFARNQFSPTTNDGIKLLAHELTHVMQQGAGARTIQRTPDEDDEPVTAKPQSCPGGAPPYLGVCLTDNILDALPAAGGDVHTAEKIVRTNATEKRAQARVQERYANTSPAALNKKIDQMREELKSTDQSGSNAKNLERLEKERDRRRALPISAPTKVDQAIAMLEEAWSLTEKEHPPDERRTRHLVHVVNTWLQEAAPVNRYDECFSGLNRTAAMQLVGSAKSNVRSLEAKFRLGASIGGWWPATINSLKAARELVQIMSGEKRIEETKFYGVSKVIDKTTWATPLAFAAAMAAPAVVATGIELIPAGLDAASWGAVRAAPRVATWIGLHPILAAEIGGAGLTLGEKASEGDLTPQDVAWTILSLGHASMSDEANMRPGGGSSSVPTRASNRLIAAFVRGLDNADVLPRFSAGGTSPIANRPVPAIVAGPPSVGTIEDMPTPFRPTAPNVSEVTPTEVATPTPAPTVSPKPPAADADISASGVRPDAPPSLTPTPAASPAPAPAPAATPGTQPRGAIDTVRAAEAYYPGHSGAVGTLEVEEQSPMYLKSGVEGGPFGGTQRGHIPRGRGEAFTSGGPSQGNIATHVEGHAAAIMHQQGVTRATLWMGMDQCAICASNLPTALPPGSELTVVHVDMATGQLSTTIYRSSQPPR
jgi:hypothetical protein